MDKAIKVDFLNSPDPEGSRKKDVMGSLDSLIDELTDGLELQQTHPEYYNALLGRITQLRTRVSDDPYANREQAFLRIIARVFDVDYAAAYTRDLFGIREGLFERETSLDNPVPAELEDKIRYTEEKVKLHNDTKKALIFESDHGHSVMIPLYMWDLQFGVMTLGHREKSFTESELKFMGVLANIFDTDLTVIYEEKLIAQLPEEYRAEVRARLKDFLQPQLTNITAMYVDISGSTSAAGRYARTEQQGRELMKKTSRYLVEFDAQTRRFGGFSDKFIGDALLALYGVPKGIAPRNDPFNAVQTAFAIHNEVDWLNKERHSKGLETHDVKVAMVAGDCMVGLLGGENKSDLTGLGDIVNHASRLESAASRRMVFVDEATADLLKDKVYMTPVADKEGNPVPIKAKGVEGGIIAYNVDSIRDNSNEKHERFEEDSFLDSKFITISGIVSSIYKGLEMIAPGYLSDPFERKSEYFVDTSRRIGNFVLALSEVLKEESDETKERLAISDIGEEQAQINLVQAALLRDRKKYRYDFEEVYNVMQVNCPITIPGELAQEETIDWLTTSRKLDLDEGSEIVLRNPIITTYTLTAAGELGPIIRATNKPDRKRNKAQCIAPAVADIISYSTVGKDGQKRPEQLKGLPSTYSQILGIASEYDALTSHRAYRPRHSIDIALDILHHKTFEDGHYTPEVYNALVAVVKAQPKE